MCFDPAWFNTSSTLKKIISGLNKPEKWFTGTICQTNEDALETSLIEQTTVQIMAT